MNYGERETASLEGREKIDKAIDTGNINIQQTHTSSHSHTMKPAFAQNKF